MVVVVRDEPPGVGQGHFPQHHHAEAQPGELSGLIESQWPKRMSSQLFLGFLADFTIFHPPIPEVKPQVFISRDRLRVPRQRSARDLATTKGFQSWFTGPLDPLGGSPGSPSSLGDLSESTGSSSRRNPPQAVSQRPETIEARS